MVINNALTRWLARHLARRCAGVMQRRRPDVDVLIGYERRLCVKRWFLVRPTKRFQTHLHQWFGSDQRELHDHAWWSVSLCLGGLRQSPTGQYLHYPEDVVEEVYRRADQPPEEEQTRQIRFGDLIFRNATDGHRMVVPTPGVTTIFITGPRIRENGWLCPQGWRHWREYKSNDRTPHGGCSDPL